MFCAKVKHDKKRTMVPRDMRFAEKYSAWYDKNKNVSSNSRKERSLPKEIPRNNSTLLTQCKIWIDKSVYGV